MQGAGSAFFCLVAIAFSSLECRDKTQPTEISLRSAEASRPGPQALPADAPEFVRSLSLLYPGSEIFRVDNKIVQKTNHALAQVVAYYQNTFSKHGYSESTRLEQVTTALLQYDRRENETTETISVDIQKVPYEESYLIRLARIDAARTYGKKE